MSTYNAQTGQYAGKWTPRPPLSAGSDQIDVATTAFQRAANEDRAAFSNQWASLAVDGKLGPGTAGVARQIRRLPEYQVGGFIVMNALQLLESVVNLDVAPSGNGGGGGGGGNGGGGGGGVEMPPAGVILPPTPGPTPAKAEEESIIPWVIGGLGLVGVGFMLLRPKKGAKRASKRKPSRRRRAA